MIGISSQNQVHFRSMTLADLETSSLPSEDLCFLSATEQAALIRQKRLSARELMHAHLRQIARLNPRLNAIVTLLPEDHLMAEALAADEAFAHGRPLGPLH